MIFAVIMVIAIWPMRRFAWWLCRRYLYPSRSAAFIIFNCVYWGVFVAVCARFMIVYFHPHWAVKWFLGYGIGGPAAGVKVPDKRGFLFRPNSRIDAGEKLPRTA
jgi:hypothetical protein